MPEDRNVRPRAFVPQIPARLDDATKLWIPSVNVNGARRFGTVETILPPQASRMVDFTDVIRVINKRMWDFTEDDCIVAVGNPAFIAAAAVIAARRTGGLLRMLVWDKHQAEYAMTEMRV